VVSPIRKYLLLGLVAVWLGACATQPPPVTKLVGGRQITTRSIDANAYEHVSRALLFEEQERWQEAAAEIQRALIFDADSPELHARLAELMLRLGRNKDAAVEVRDSLKIEVSVPGLLADAHWRRAQGDLAGAVSVLSRAQKEVDFQDGDDDAESVYLELADMALKILNIPTAQNSLEVLCQAEPASATGHMRLTAIYWAQGEMGKAASQLRAALVEEPNQIEALVALAWIHAASGKNEDARRVFLEAIDRSEGALEIASAYARFLVGIGSPKEAEQLADDLSVPDSGLDAETVGARIELERSAHRLDRALALVERTREMNLTENQKGRIVLLQAALLKDQGKNDKAIALLLKVDSASPLFFESRLRAAELLRDAGQYEKATSIVDAAMKTAKGERESIELDAAINLALIDEKRGDPKSGIKRLEQVLARYPGEGRVILVMAALEERRGNWNQALTLAEGLLAKNPGSVEALNFWGFVAADHNHALDLASKRLQVANAIDPGSGGLIDSLGWVSLRRKDLAKASLFLEQAARLEPADPEIQWHLGELFIERKEHELATAAFQRALTFHPDDRLRHKVEESLARIAGRRISGK
jgi:Tfp pilus assembly protein PilF